MTGELKIRFHNFGKILIFPSMKSSVVKILTVVFLIGGCTSQIRESHAPVKTSSEKEFLYMEELYAHASNSFKSGDIDGAYAWYERLEQDYPDNPYRAESLFIRGYILKTFRDEPENAEILFRKLLDGFPGSDFYNAAVFELKHINDPGFIPEFEK